MSAGWRLRLPLTDVVDVYMRGALGGQDVAVEVASDRDPVLMLVSYFILFLGTGFLVALYMLLVDRGFREVLGRFI